MKLGSHSIPTGLQHPTLEWGQLAGGSQGLGVLWVLFTLGATKGGQGHFFIGSIMGPGILKFAESCVHQLTPMVAGSG